MKKKIFLLISFLMLVFSLTLSSLETAAAYDYIPTFSVFKTDNMESLTVPTDTKLATADYIWGYTNLLWAETNNVKETKDALSGDQSLNWMPGAGDSEGWTASTQGIGISPNKTAGSSGGFLLKLEFLLKLKDVDMLVVKAFDSNNVIRQEMIVTGDYENGSDASTLDKGEETVVNIEKRSETASGKKTDHALVSFTIRSSATLVTYYTFTIKSKGVNATVTLDDLTLYKEDMPKIPHRYYDEFLEEGFEVQNVEDTIFTGEQVNVKSLSISNDKFLMGNSSLLVEPSVRNKDVTVRSKNISLKQCYYKLYFKFNGTYVTKAGINVRSAATNEIIYDFIVNPVANERISTVANPLFDKSDFYFDSGNTFSCYGEFESVAEQEVYLELYYYASNVKGTLLFDDINLMEQYTPVYPETYPSNDPDKITGDWTAKYENLAGDITEYLGSEEAAGCVGSIFVSLLGILGLTGLLLVAKKKKTAIANKVMMLLLSMVTVFALSSCNKEQGVKLSDNYQYLAYDRIEGKLDNPGMGWVMLEESTYGGHVDIGSSGDFPEVDNVSLSTSWAAIEQEEGVFDFSICDQTVDYWTELGKRVNLRICTDNLVLTYTYRGCPDWLFDKYNVNSVMVDYTDPGPVTECRVVDVRDKNYLKFLDRFLEALYEHYKDNEMVDVVEIRGFGIWGEWHHGWTFDSKEQRMASLDNVLSHWYNAFADSGKLMCVCSSWDPDYTTTGGYYAGGATDDEAYMNYVNWSSFDTVWRTEGMTFRRDSGGALMYYDLDERIMAEAFRSGKRVPLLGEYATSYYVLTTPNNAFNLMSGINDILYKMRPNYSTALGWVAVEIANYTAKGETEFVDRANSMFGYRLAVDTAYIPKVISNNGNVEVMTTWSNTAVGVFPYKADLKYHLLDENNNIVSTIVDSNFDARLFVQGEVNNFYSELKLPEGVANGNYKLAVSVEYKDQKIALGMAGETAENSRMYVLSDVTVNNSVKNSVMGEELSLQKTTFDKKDQIKFEANSTYEITFKYLPKFNIANFYFGTNDYYEFSLVSDKASETDVDKVVGNYKFQDISGEIGQKTIVVSTGNYSDYKLNVTSHNFDEISVDEIWVRKVNAETENFEDYSVLDASTIIEPINITTAEEAEESIDGRGLKLQSSNISQEHILAKIDTNNYTFKKGVQYKITFDFRNLGQVGNGGYFFLASGDYANVKSSYKIFGEWYERDDNWDTKKTFIFTPEEDGQTVAFGVNASGMYMIDNLIISSQEVNDVKLGTDLGFKHNEIPVHNSGFGIVETFERGSFQASGYEWGQFAWGRMTFDENEVAGYSETNKSSILCRIEEEAYNPLIDNVWFEFLRSKKEYFQFEANEFYKVSFQYKIIKKFDSGKVFCFFRDDTMADRFARAVNAPYLMTDNDCDITAGKTVGEVYTFEYAFQIGDGSNYQFMFCANGLWEISVDNILIEKVTEAEARTINGK